MTEEKNIKYPEPMLSSIDYDNLGIDLDPFTLTDLEYRTKENDLATVFRTNF